MRGRIFILSLYNTDEFLLRGEAFCSENLTSELQMTGGSRGRRQEMQRERVIE